MTDKDILDLGPETEALDEPSRGVWKRLKRGLMMSHTEVLEKIDAALAGRTAIDASTLEGLEEALIGADIGVAAALELVEGLKRDAKGYFAGDPLKLRQRLVDEMAILLLDAPQPRAAGPGPRITLMVGVNGVGKTTSIAKLARLSQRRGESVILAAADTFRAAASEQLALWGERLGIDVIRQGGGADPAAVVYDAIQAARARKIDHLLIDTAGRLHTKSHLMAELAKIGRVIDREAGDWSRQTLLVLDATTGQNAVSQAREFTLVVAVDGVLLAKVDGTAKGGVAVAIARELRLPVVYLGVGESAEDLVAFQPREFAAALLG